MNKQLTLPALIDATGGQLMVTSVGASGQVTRGEVVPDSQPEAELSPVPSLQGTLTIKNSSVLSFNKVVYDSRLVEPGSLFVALTGENTDGHLFIKDAIARGAVALLVRDDWGESQQVLPEIPCVGVADTLVAFHKLAGWWRSQFSALNVVGITGSVGKTSTKELSAAVLGRKFNVFKSPKSLNNEYSLMPVILQLQDEHQQAVLELGAGWEFGELRRVCEVVKPVIGVELGVSHSHLSRMKSLENLALNKAELVESLPANGWAVLNGDDTRVKAMAGLTKARVFYFGTDPNFDLWADGVESYGLEGIAFTAHYQGEAHRLELPLLGRHNVTNALAACAVGILCELSWEEIEAGLKTPGTQIRLQLKQGLNDSFIIDDSYNASAVSVVAALDLLSDISVKGHKLALLGDMLELGEFTGEAHRQVGIRAAQVVDKLILVGDYSRVTGQAALENGLSADRVVFAGDKADAAAYLQQVLQKGDYLLVKASRAAALEDVIAKVSANND